MKPQTLVLLCIFGFSFIDALTIISNGKLNQLCSTDKDCKDPFTRCVDNHCKCRDNYMEHSKKCFGGIGSECATSADCLSTRSTCLDKKCALIKDADKKGDKMCYKKSKSSVCWTPKDKSTDMTEFKVSDGYMGKEGSVCRVYGAEKAFVVSGVVNSDSKCQYIWSFESYTADDYELLVKDDKLDWKNEDFTMDQAVYGSPEESGTMVTLQCRTSFGKPKYYGRLSPPNFDLCVYVADKKFDETHLFDVLVHESC